MIYSCFCKGSTIGQFNIQAATAEDEEQYTFSNITFHNISKHYISKFLSAKQKVNKLTKK